MKDNGREVRVARNDSIVLKLPENPTTGVRWSVEDEAGLIEIVSDRYEPQESGGAIGAATTRVLTLKPRHAGRGTIQLKRSQEWERSAAVDATFNCTLNVE